MRTIKSRSVFNDIIMVNKRRLLQLIIMKHYLISFVILFSAHTLSGQTYPSIHSSRPRIYADSSRFTWLSTNILLPGDCKDTYDEFLYRYENWWINDPQLFLDGTDSTLWTWNWGSGYARDEAVFTIFLCKLNQDTLSQQRCRFIARKIIDTVTTANLSSMTFYERENFFRKFSDVSSLMIDWGESALTDTLLHDLVKSHFELNNDFMDEFILSPFGNSYVSSHNAWNCVYANQNALALYNAYGLTATQNDTVTQWYQAVFDKWANGFLPCYGYYRDDDGGWNWGAAYSMWSLVDQFQLFDNMLIGTGHNYYTALPWVQNSINQYWYFIRPDEWSLHLGDGVTFLAADRVVYRHAALFSDPRSIWLAQKYSTPAYYYSTPVVFQKLLYKDFNINTISNPNPPLDWWSDKVGLSVSRTGWDSSATMVTFFNSPGKRAAHEHRDNNSFTVFKNRPLLLDAGTYDTYGGSHYLNYYQRSIAHNTICVYDSLESYSNFGQPASNDGGQIESYALQNYNDIFLPQNQRGKWIRYADGFNYQYNVADAQLSYDTSKVSFFRRRLLFDKPDKILILDHLHLKNVLTQQREVKWIAHFANEPTISGTQASVIVPDHIEVFNGTDYSAIYGNGSIALRTLLPSATTATRIGGSGYEYWVDGQNYPPLSPPDTLHGTPGRWRVEVIPSGISDTVLMLHSISVGDSNNIAMAGGVSLMNGISVGADWNDCLYFFPTSGDTGVTYHVFQQVQGNRTVKLFANDLVQGVYEIRIDGINVATVATDLFGTLRDSVFLSNGTHTVEIVSPTTYLQQSLSGASTISLYPVPVDDYFQIKYQSDINEPVTLSIINAIGQPVINMSISDETSVRTAELPQGFYTAEFIGKTFVARIKFVIRH